MKNSFNDLKTNLTENDINQIVSIVCRKCRVDTYRLVRSILTYHPSSIPHYGILERLTKEPDGTWFYCAGQSYPDEIRTVREIIIKG